MVLVEFAETIEHENACIEVNDLGSANIIPFQFQQLMHNLMGNSLKFSKPGSPPHIVITSELVKGHEVGLEGMLPHNSYCHITFKDFGIGFKEEFNEKVFEVFQRLHGRDEYPGTGIGLAIVKKIVENHNGVIKVTSELDKGTTFDIYIPATA
jgi:two-component system CheB/CheR fusion protein